jgi:hypothetical protein
VPLHKISPSLACGMPLCNANGCPQVDNTSARNNLIGFSHCGQRKTGEKFYEMEQSVVQTSCHKKFLSCLNWNKCHCAFSVHTRLNDVVTRICFWSLTFITSHLTINTHCLDYKDQAVDSVLCENTAGHSSTFCGHSANIFVLNRWYIFLPHSFRSSLLWRVWNLSVYS